MALETFAKIWAIGWLITSIISTFRAIRGKQVEPASYFDVVAYTIAWPIYLGIFLVRWTKYKLRGKSL